MEKKLTNRISTESGEDVFQLRMLANEGVGLLTAKSNRSYLILDSADYWYDLIQTKYPPKKKCKCKNDWFAVEFNYIYRENYDDIYQVNVLCQCTACNKQSVAASINIRYSPTAQLIVTPISYCAKPKLKYKYHCLNSYWDRSDNDKLLAFMMNMGYDVYAFYFKNNVRILEKMPSVEAVPEPFLKLFITKEKLELSVITQYIDDKGPYIYPELWRRAELIECSYYIFFSGWFCNTYSTQFINNKGEIVDKSKSFEEDTNQMRQWMSNNYITKRGIDCFDNEMGYARISEWQKSRK